MSVRPMRGVGCEAVVIGAGPYGLAVAAHLKDRSIDVHVFGEPMSFWRRHMPKGMFLRSPWGATHISAPHEALSLDDYLAARRLVRIEPLPLETFLAYGEWFQARTVPDLDRRKVEHVETSADGFRVIVAGGEAINARRVVVAMGLANQAHRPPLFARMTDSPVTHSSDHESFEQFRGRQVAVIGRGQSACESAALLYEAGADVELICRGPIHWLGGAGLGVLPTGLAPFRATLARLLDTRSAVGPFPLNRMIEFPHLVHGLPHPLRLAFNAVSLRAGAAGWLRPRFGGVRVVAGARIERAIEKGGRIELTLGGRVASYDHVLLATGYKTDLAKLDLLAPRLLNAVVCRDGAPVLSGGFESSVPGLHFVGASAVASFGPLMRFIAGTRFAAREVTNAIAIQTKSLRGMAPEDSLAA